MSELEIFHRLTRVRTTHGVTDSAVDGWSTSRCITSQLLVIRDEFGVRASPVRVDESLRLRKAGALRSRTG
jgi:hypothetical protein